jgi:AcrR family transcriptional regulator
MNKGNLRPMTDDGRARSSAKRGYHSPRRVEQAAATRHAVLAAAQELFVRNGYTTTTVTQIADRARVSVDTVYAAVGRKPTLLRELVEAAISSTDPAAPGEQRDYVARIRAASTAREKIAILARALPAVQQRTAPVFMALRDAASTDRECAALWAEIAERRSSNVRLFAADLRSTGGLRDDLSVDQIADAVWSMSSAEYWMLLVDERGWTPAAFSAWLDDAWTRLLL